jgi:hypothetical protein
VAPPPGLARAPLGLKREGAERVATNPIAPTSRWMAASKLGLGGNLPRSIPRPYLNLPRSSFSEAKRAWKEGRGIYAPAL